MTRPAQTKTNVDFYHPSNTEDIIQNLLGNYIVPPATEADSKKQLRARLIPWRMSIQRRTLRKRCYYSRHSQSLSQDIPSDSSLE